MISIIHPSRWRPEVARKTHNEWMENADNPQQIEYIVSIDMTDSMQNKYFDVFKDTNAKIIVNNNRSIVDAVNNGAKAATQNIFVVVSDDFSCPENWDMNIVGYCHQDEPVLLHVNDTVQNYISTIPIINRPYYQRFGFIYHPHYFSMFADNDLTDCAKIIGAYVSDFSLIFEHKHFIVGKNKRDKTYDRQNSKQAWEIGKRIYQQRKQRNFDLK